MSAKLQQMRNEYAEARPRLGDEEQSYNDFSSGGDDEEDDHTDT